MYYVVTTFHLGFVSWQGVILLHTNAKVAPETGIKVSDLLLI